MTATHSDTESASRQPVVWITGGGSGIGRCLALSLSRQGRRVVISGRTPDKLESVAAEAGGAALSTKAADVTDREALERVVAEIEAEVGPIETAILNAGDYTPMGLATFDAELFRKLIEVNYLGVVNCMQALLPAMLDRQAGEILITASLSGYRGLPKAAPYGASKAALISMAESLQPELKQKGVSLRLINPGFVRSALTDKNDFEMPFLITPEEAARQILDKLPAKGFEIAFPRRFAAILKLMRCLPYALYLRFMQRLLK